MVGLFLLLVWWGCRQPEERHAAGDHAGNTARAHAGDAAVTTDHSDLPFTRHPGRLILTKHAKCRMGCRHITEKEIREVLERGSVNDRKSDPNAHPDAKYAVEGHTDEGQNLRIIVAAPPGGDALVIVTCMELGVEWQCDCH